MINTDHKYSAPVNFLVNDHNDSAAMSGSSMATKWYRHLIAPRIPTGLWIRQILEQTEDYLIYILNQSMAMRGESSNCCMIVCGGGYDVLLLRNDTPFPEYVDDVPRIGLSLLLTSTIIQTNSEENVLEEYGIVDPDDALHMHMNVAVNMGVFPGNFRIYLRSDMNCPAYQDSHLTKKVILRIENHVHNAARILKVDQKDAPKHIFSYQYDVWGMLVVTPPQANSKMKAVRTNEQYIAEAKQSTQQPSRKRARKETTGVVRTTSASDDNLIAKQGSHVTARKKTIALAKSTVVTALKKTNGSSSMAAAKKQEKPNVEQDDMKNMVVPDTKVNDRNAMIDGTSRESSSSKGSKAKSSQNANKKKVTNDDKRANGVDNSRNDPTTNQPKSNVSRDITKKKECFYFPFCQMSADLCGGTQRGRCREVKSGRVTVSPDIDRKVLSDMKRKAKNEQQ